ncbi:MAG: hypothetical protein AAF938_15895 [Myxococcota bacterium]
MYVLGADENGLGPQLGPLVATACCIEVPNYERVRLRDLGAAIGVTDSKQSSAFGKMRRAEGFALALIERSEGRVPESVDALLELIGPGLSKLRLPCPGGPTEAQCWSLAMALPAFDGSLDEGRKLIDELEGASLRFHRIRTTLACAGVLNAEKAHGRSKVQVDLALFEALINDARATTSEDLLAICGMVGGIRAYARYFQHLEDAEEYEAQAYRVPGVGDVRFEVKADDRHLPVAVASMVGKYVRELLMHRIVDYYRADDASLRRVSGYHDPSTKAFVAATKERRRALPIADACFFR